jgi:hypothetical protein
VNVIGGIMSVSTYITFLKDREYHNKMLEAVRSLLELNVEKLPIEIANYFGTVNPKEALNDTDEILDIEHIGLDDHRYPPYAHKADTDYENAVEIDIDKLPSNVKHIRIARS